MEEFRKSARGQVLIRGSLMLVFGLLLNLAMTLVGVLAFIQFLWMLITTDRNQFIADISSDLSRWMSATVQFLLGQSEEKPFPWSSQVEPCLSTSWRVKYASIRLTVSGLNCLPALRSRALAIPTGVIPRCDSGLSALTSSARSAASLAP